MSSDGFLRSGAWWPSCGRPKVYAGRTTQCTDCRWLVHSLVSFLTSQVSTGSNVHCFAGIVLSTFATSSDVTGLKCDSGSDTERLVMSDAGVSVIDMFGDERCGCISDRCTDSFYQVSELLSTFVSWRFNNRTIWWVKNRMYTWPQRFVVTAAGVNYVGLIVC